MLPVLSLLRDYFSITDTDTPPEARDKVTARLLALDPGLDEILPLLLDFLEVPDPERPAAGLDSEVRMRRILDALHRITARRSEREVLVLLVEDLHWFDPQSDAFLERLIESFPGSRTLVVTNFRPEFSARWMRHSYYRQLPLAPLGDQAVGDLLGGLVGADPSLAPLRGFVLERTGGNPFFVEEMVRALVEDGTLAGRPGHYQLTRPLAHIRVPPTIQATLAARIDRLSAEHKATLQAAAVIGRAFPVPVLAGVTDVTDDVLEDAMRALCGAELLQETAGGPVGEYRFWHPLTQEVAYDSLLAGRRAQLHTAVAETLANDEQRAGERAGVIAWHWERAGRPVEAARWNFEAGNWALRSDLGEAQRRWRAAIDLLEGVPETDESLNVGIWARARLCQFGARTGMAPDEAERLYTEGPRPGGTAGRSQAARLGRSRVRIEQALDGRPAGRTGPLRRGRPDGRRRPATATFRPPAGSVRPNRWSIWDHWPRGSPGSNGTWRSAPTTPTEASSMRDTARSRKRSTPAPASCCSPAASPKRPETSSGPSRWGDSGRNPTRCAGR